MCSLRTSRILTKAVGIITAVLQTGIIFGVIIWSTVITWIPQNIPQKVLKFMDNMDYFLAKNGTVSVQLESAVSRIGMIWANASIEIAVCLIKISVAVGLIKAADVGRNPVTTLKLAYSWVIVNVAVIANNCLRILIWGWENIVEQKLFRAIGENVLCTVFIIIVATFLQKVQCSLKSITKMYAKQCEKDGREIHK